MSDDGWSIDLGTTNTVVARWQGDSPEVVLLPEIARAPAEDGSESLGSARAIPSATELIEDRGWAHRLGRWGPLLRNAFVGRHAFIGRQALDRNAGAPTPAFARSFKGALAASPLRTLARTADRAWSARDTAAAFLRELLADITRTTGDRPRDVVFTAPVDCFERYRAETQAIAQGLGVRRVRFLDEPIAAAIGYGVGLDSDRRVLVVDFGGGTLDVALLGLSARSVEAGRAEILAKDGRPVGGDLVDDWILRWVCERLDIDSADEALRHAPGAAVWLELMRQDARRVKEALHLQPHATFLLIPPRNLRRFEAQLQGDAEPVDVSRDDLVGLLERRGAYAALEACIDAVVGQGEAPPDEVLMVGGSTLLPGVFPLLEDRFGRDRVRGWQPFEAVAYGAAAYAKGHAVRSDFIVHDYALTTRDQETGEVEHTVIIPRGTRFPTAPNVWRRKLVPTCPFGEPETVYKLLVSEVGRSSTHTTDPDDDRRFAWDAEGALHGPSDAATVVPLNEADPTLGRLSPPHQPGDRRPRLDLAFGVNAERWLMATVIDLHSGRTLMKERPVVRLL